ncbi:MAG: GntR family transcriptional regulator [Hypericibacter sp.]
MSSSDQVVGEILRGLYAGRFAPGQKLAEAELSKRFGVGRGTVREALRQMAAEGIVAVNMHKGASIRLLTRDDARDIVEVVESIAGLSARLAAERGTAQGKGELRDLLAAMRPLTAHPDSFDFARARADFYAAVTILSGNRELVRLLSTVQVHLVRIQFRTAYWADQRDLGLIHYERMVDAILAGDALKAERAFRAHMRAFARAVEALPDAHFG